MTQELTRYDVAPPAPVVTEQQIDLIKRTVAAGATDAELQLYLYDCQRHGVHPLDKLLHFTKRSNKYTPITSIDLLRSRAADTGELAGIDDPQYQGEVARTDFTATATVWRLVQGQRCPFSATARWSEYKPDQDHMWRKMPYLMLGKCAEALALRKAFPRQLAGLYASEEMEQSGTPPARALPPTPRVNPTTGEVIEPPRVLPAKPERSDAPRPEQTPALMTRLKELIGQAREAKIVLPPSARQNINRMSDEELDQAIQDLDKALNIQQPVNMQAEEDLPL